MLPEQATIPSAVIRQLNAAKLPVMWVLFVPRRWSR